MPAYGLGVVIQTQLMHVLFEFTASFMCSRRKQTYYRNETFAPQVETTRCFIHVVVCVVM